VRNSIIIIYTSHNRAKILWLQDPNQSSIDNLSHVRREGSRQFREKEGKLNELETNRTRYQ